LKANRPGRWRFGDPSSAHSKMSLACCVPFSYAAYAGLKNNAARHPEYLTRLEPWTQLWERSAAAEFLRA